MGQFRLICCWLAGFALVFLGEKKTAAGPIFTDTDETGQDLDFQRTARTRRGLYGINTCRNPDINLELGSRERSSKTIICGPDSGFVEECAQAYAKDNPLRCSGGQHQHGSGHRHLFDRSENRRRADSHCLQSGVAVVYQGLLHESVRSGTHTITLTTTLKLVVKNPDHFQSFRAEVRDIKNAEDRGIERSGKLVTFDPIQLTWVLRHRLPTPGNIVIIVSGVPKPIGMVQKATDVCWGLQPVTLAVVEFTVPALQKNQRVEERANFIRRQRQGLY